jgi:Flp pilus assembly pilin Flp
MRRFFALIRCNSAAAAVEYALIVAIIGGATAIAAIALGNAVLASTGKATTEITTCGDRC